MNKSYNEIIPWSEHATDWNEVNLHNTESRPMVCFSSSLLNENNVSLSSLHLKKEQDFILHSSSIRTKYMLSIPFNVMIRYWQRKEFLTLRIVMLKINLQFWGYISHSFGQMNDSFNDFSLGTISIQNGTLKNG